MPKRSEPSEETRIRQARLLLELRSKGIANQAVLRAIEQVAREDFLPPHLQSHAYDERVLPLPCGQQTIPPFLMARLFETLKPMPTDKILLIGSGLGYTAAVLSRLFRRVFVVERYRQLLVGAEDRLRAGGFSGIVSRLGDGLEGWEDEAPFDAILCTAGLDSVPESLVEQCRRPARIVYPQMIEEHAAVITRITLPKTGGEERESFEAMASTRLVKGTALAL